MEIYCLCCRKLVPAGEAFRVMRTGFYQRTIPLGLCTVCKAHGDQVVNAENSVLCSLVYKPAEAS